MSLSADVADHISAPGLLKNSPSAQLVKLRIALWVSAARLSHE